MRLAQGPCPNACLQFDKVKNRSKFRLETQNKISLIINKLINWSPRLDTPPINLPGERRELLINTVLLNLLSKGLKILNKRLANCFPTNPIPPNKFYAYWRFHHRIKDKRNDFSAWFYQNDHFNSRFIHFFIRQGKFERKNKPFIILFFLNEQKVLIFLSTIINNYSHIFSLSAGSNRTVRRKSIVYNHKDYL